MEQSESSAFMKSGPISPITEQRRPRHLDVNKKEFVHI
jgi:hypothetical protein